jgi:hypothetical protein
MVMSSVALNRPRSRRRGKDLVDECGEPVFVGVEGQDEPVGGSGIEVFLEEVGRVSRCACQPRGVVERAVGDHVAR